MREESATRRDDEGRQSAGWRRLPKVYYGKFRLSERDLTTKWAEIVV